MSTLSVVRCSVVAALVVFAGCDKQKTAALGTSAQSNSGPDLAPDFEVATFAGQKITAAQLDEKVKPQLQEAEEEFQKQKFQVRQQTLDRMILESLLEAEAKKRGLPNGEAVLKSEVDDKVPTPPDDKVKQLYEASASRLPPGATLEQYKGQIIDFLTRQEKQDKARAFFDGLKKNANVVVKLPEPTKPRKQVEAKGPSRGPDDAKITVVEFSDFECPFCQKGHDTMDEVLKAYDGKIKMYFRQFPLDFHPHAQKAAEASLCANEQGKFWPYHDSLFKNREKLEVPQLKEYAAAVGMDAAKFNACLEQSKFAAQVKEDMEAGRKVGVSGTPAFFINGVMLSGAQPVEEFKKIIDSELASK
ncbi:MAG: thioredoxin domain-containing protein [Myxococcaceae bacterium]